MRSSATGLSVSLLLMLASAVAAAAAPGRPTAQELRWIEGAWPVVEQATRAGLPVDIVVQPQPAPGEPPMALAYLGGRCKLVFSMRDNPLVPEQEQRIERDLGAGKASLDAALELMAAHELFGHCARRVAGRWHELPDGYAEPAPVGLDPALHAEFSEMRADRREEGFADLAALAWARANRPSLYARLHDWLAAERSHDRIGGSQHDTLAWLRRADIGQAAVADVWRLVLLEEAAGQAR